MHLHAIVKIDAAAFIGLELPRFKLWAGAADLKFLRHPPRGKVRNFKIDERHQKEWRCGLFVSEVRFGGALS